ncbi:hypothetical protein GCM10010198_74990 [Nocardia seriolae]|nr:hypothetical protein NSERKGN1266_57610 [Nocardia seriolae]BEK94574.1 hypothetical protein NSER024013_24800 [Nocardia seriolae]GEM22984.1 hypothetical protein NS2_12230 [Nocardia seriolae NBRC 15557]
MPRYLTLVVVVEGEVVGTSITSGTCPPPSTGTDDDGEGGVSGVPRWSAHPDIAATDIPSITTVISRLGTYLNLSTIDARPLNPGAFIPNPHHRRSIGTPGPPSGTTRATTATLAPASGTFWTGFAASPPECATRHFSGGLG